LPPTSSGVPGAFWGTGRSTAPASPCSRWGLPGQRHHCRCRCALTAPFHPRIINEDAICSLLHLPSGCPARPLAGIVALWSADFPRQARALPRFPRSTRISHYTAIREVLRQYICVEVHFNILADVHRAIASKMASSGTTQRTN